MRHSFFTFNWFVFLTWKEYNDKIVKFFKVNVDEASKVAEECGISK